MNMKILVSICLPVLMGNVVWADQIVMKNGDRVTGSIIKKTGKSREEVVAHFVKDVPMGRLIQPQEVAAAVLYLCSSDAGAVTGTALAVAGGEV